MIQTLADERRKIIKASKINKALTSARVCTKRYAENLKSVWMWSLFWVSRTWNVDECVSGAEYHWRERHGAQLTYKGL